MENNKKGEILRTVLAVGISVVLFITWFAIEPILFPRPENETEDVTQEVDTQDSDIDSNVSSTDVEDVITTEDTLSSDALSLYPVNKASRDYIETFETEKYIIQFNRKGAVIKDLRYKEFIKNKELDLNNIKRYESAVYAESIQDSEDYDFIERPLRGLSLDFVTGNKIYKEPEALYDYKVDKQNKKVIFTSIFSDNNGNKIEITKTYIFNNTDSTEDDISQYDFDVEISFRNISDKNIAISNDENTSFYLHWGGGVGPYTKQTNNRYGKWYPFLAKKTGRDINVLTKVEDFNKNDRDSKGVMDSFHTSWLGCGNRYFLISLIPDYKSEKYINVESSVYNTSRKSAIENQTDFFGIGYSDFILKKGETKSAKLTIYAGPKKHRVLSKYGIRMERTAEHAGILEFLVRFLEWILLSINGLVQNYGLSIIIATLLLRLVLFPLQAKSLKSMSKMKDLQPKMAELKEKYKDKPEMLNKATMELYKKEKINPLGGCFPMLLQLPFFIAFFNVMPYLVELRGETFLWINDLSSPDTIFNLSFWPNQFNLLPLLMTGIMFAQTQLQQKIQPSTGGMGGGSGMQMKIFTFVFPLIFLFITYYAPAGLSIYWTTSILFGIVQQLLFTHFKNKKEEEAKTEILDSKGKKVKRKK